ncbi:MAG: hypothetical protein ACREPN_04020 [Rudaea sp.]
MRPRDLAGLVFAAGCVLVCAGVCAAAPDYGKVDTFQPGKKYNCVPTADRKGWDCTENGKADVPPPEPVAPPASTSTEAAPTEAATTAVVPSTAAPQSAGTLPGYLTNAAAARPMQSMPAAPTAKPAPRPRATAKPIPQQAPAVQATATSPVGLPAHAMPARATHTPAEVSDFLALPAASYVIELAHGATRTDIAAAPHPSHEKVYELHLRQNDADVWLLLWGPFTDLQTARAAREELAAQGATPGWPRRIGPLQTEMHRTQP